MSMEWNRNLYERIRAAADRGAVHHALLLTGPKGSGKGELARFIAAAMECQAPQGRPCGVCPACRKVFDGIHPDVIAVRDEERKLLSVDTVRQVCADAYIRPNEGARKVYVFEDSGQLDGRCQDILLKTVEEGPRYAAFLFLSENAAAILPTIRSRCVELKLRGGEETEENGAMVDRAVELGLSVPETGRCAGGVSVLSGRGQAQAHRSDGVSLRGGGVVYSGSFVPIWPPSGQNL